MIEKTLQATLRLHSSSITCIEPFYLPSTLTYTLGDPIEYPIFNPTLMTADESGLIIWWNLTTHRPLGLWKAHDDNILTVKQLGIEWGFQKDYKFSIPRLTDSYGQLLTHSKDGTIKIWKMIDMFDNMDSKSGFTYSCILRKKISNSNNSKPETKPPILFEMPVNTLNFANVDINSKGYLLTPATTDSEGWDLYETNCKELDEYKKLKRLIQNHKFKTQKNVEKIEEIFNHDENDNSDPNFTKRVGLGVIMKFKWIDNSRFLVGYESGKIVGYKLEQEGETGIDFKVIQFLENDSLLGNPITSIYIDNINDNILCSSTGSKVCIIKLSSDEHEFNIFDTKHKGINDITSDSYSKSVCLITWDGYTRIYQYDDDNILKFNFKMRRQLPAISNSKEASIDENNDITKVNSLQTQRANILKFTKMQVDPVKVKNSDVHVMYNNGRSKNIVRRNREDIFGQRWMFVGYQDGKIALYSIQ